MIDLLLQFIAHQVLHLPLSIYYVLCHLLVFLWTEVRLCWLLDVFFVYLAAHLVHLHLFVQNLANRLLLLLPLNVCRHLEPIVLFFKCL